MKVMTTRARGKSPLPWLGPGILIGALVPLAVIVVGASLGRLGANPIEEVLNEIGLLALIFLVASLACTPLKTFLGWTWPIRVRRQLGLFAFFYAVLHVSVYAGLDQFGDVRAILDDLSERKFIFVGFATLVLLTPLALTSTSSSIRRLGFPRWKRLHRLAYLAAPLAVIHFVWRVKRDVTEPVIYAIILAALLLARVIDGLRATKAARLT